MRNLKLSWAFFAIILVIASCKRDFNLPEEEATNKSNTNIEAKDLVVPAGFNFDAEKTLNVRVKVADAKANERYAIKIYADVPSLGKLISTGLTNANAEYNTTVRVPANEEYIYIEKIDPNGNSKYEKVKTNQFTTALFTNGQTPKPYILRKSSGMNCSTGCTVTYNNPSTDITVNNGDIACITGTINNINITVQAGGIAKVCGSGTVKGFVGNANSEVYVLEGAILTVTEDIVMFDNTIFKNYSDSLKLLYSIVFYDCIAENNGRIYHPASPSMDLYQDAVFTNNGYINISSNILMLDRSTIINNNEFYANAILDDGEAKFINNCHTEALGDFYVAGTLENYAYIKAGTFWQDVANWTLVTTAHTKIHDGAMISTTNLKLVMGDIEGTGTNRSKIKVSANTNISTGAIIKGVVDLCDNNGIESNAGTIQTPALASCAGYIATTTCNPEGFGTTGSTDTDNDGVADAQDEYPNDATRAFNSYYPNLSTMATVAFEDLWPSKADYDFNDLVVLFNIQQVLNANNEVVDYKVKLKVKAVGGTFVNGFGFQLDDLIPADITNVTGQVLVENLITRNANNTEAGQNKAVIICYDSPEPTIQRASGSMFNTIKTNPTGTSDTIFINVSLASPIASTKLNIDKFNPFIFTNKRRGYEIHLGNFKPTDLANTNLLGTFEDRTNAGNGIYYKNSQGLPWAILIPAEFSHPKEKTPITSAYNFFDDWAISGGTSFTTWYSNAVGNQNTDNIY